MIGDKTRITKLMNINDEILGIARLLGPEVLKIILEILPAECRL
jgi:hypothetical protein